MCNWSDLSFALINANGGKNRADTILAMQPDIAASPTEVSWLDTAAGFWTIVLLAILVIIFAGPVFRGFVNWMRRMR
jgi:hypothetical protein